ncbi:hypothetical protein T12_7138 [Trichinella patagoniensis]|uniref:Uncharacterized protein n=1 Tax=Trichinella patagoniensis TaxID=990121 RepID=A0A0V0ZQK3_9BILA|nr:hypothetical protein T12_7138 [Trichinella patagoniensis]
MHCMVYITQDADSKNYRLNDFQIMLNAVHLKKIRAAIICPYMHFSSSIFQIMFLCLLYAFKRSSVNSLFLGWSHWGSIIFALGPTVHLLVVVFAILLDPNHKGKILINEQLDKENQYDKDFTSSITPFCVTAYSIVPCVPLGVGLDPVYGYVGLDPLDGYVGLDPLDGDVGLDPLDGYVGLDPLDGDVGLDPVDGHVTYDGTLAYTPG